MSPTTIKVKKLHESAQLPEKAFATDAGADVRYCAALDENALYSAFAEPQCVILPGERRMLPTGISVEIPVGYEIQVRPRSGLALKHGITVINTPGTIDADYRGPCNVILLNTSNEPVRIDDGERIAQFVVAEVTPSLYEEVDILTDTNRGEGGFGHTGRH